MDRREFVKTSSIVSVAMAPVLAGVAEATEAPGTVSIPVAGTVSGEHRTSASAAPTLRRSSSPARARDITFHL